MGDRGLLDLESLLELAHTKRIMLSEEADHLQPDLVAQRGERRGLLSDLSLIEVGAGDRRHATIVAAPPLERNDSRDHWPSVSTIGRVAYISKYIGIIPLTSVPTCGIYEACPRSIATNPSDLRLRSPVSPYSSSNGNSPMMPHV